jgi:membrane associated rhomboid family serine protease
VFPIRDENPTFRTPVVTYILIAINVAVWLLVEGAGTEPRLVQAVCDLGMIPGEFLKNIPAGTELPAGGGATCTVGDHPTWYTPVTSMFLHGGWLHLLGNMWFLHIFGNNVEDSMGRFRYLAFYLLCGIAAALTQTLLSPTSGIPMVGASGAIGGVMGAYVVLYPRVQIHMLIFLFVIVTRIVVPAFWMLGYWFLLQLVGGWGSWGSNSGGTAFWAHVGGFVAGVLLVWVFRNPELVAEHRATMHNFVRGHFRERPS